MDPVREFWFESPTQEEVERRLAALDVARHAAHRPGEPARYCPHCPPSNLPKKG